MRGALVLPLALAVACSSSTSPDRDPLSGIWQATTASLPAGLSAYQVTLTQVNDTITGTALLEYIGDRSVELQVRGHAGLGGSQSCFPERPIVCHVTFSFQATDASGDEVFFQGQFKNGNLLFGDVQSSSDLPFWNVDGLELQLQRVATPS
jgi:hypothetical protein